MTAGAYKMDDRQLVVESPTFAVQGVRFQEGLAQLILDDSTFCGQILEVLDVNFFELKYLRLFTQKIIDYRKKYGVHPSRDTVGTILRSEIASESEVLQKQVREYYARVLSLDAVDGSEHIKDVSLDFCRKQKLKEAMIKSVELIKSSSFDEVSKVINDALKLGTDNNHGYDYIADFEKRFIVKARNPISTGWDLIDNITKGGLGKRELGVVIASTGSGKSQCMVHLGSAALRQGKNVVYYTLELQDTVVASRFDSCLTGININDLHMHKDNVLDVVKDIKGKLIVKEYPSKSASTVTIRNHIEKLISHGFQPDMIIVDYADLLKPATREKEKRQELESIYEELRGIAQLYDCTMFTCSQTNRCFSKDTTIYTLEEDGSLVKKNVNELKVGDKVETINGFKSVVDTCTSEQKTYTVTLRNGKKITVSSKHVFPTKNGFVSIDNGLTVGTKLLTKKC